MRTITTRSELDALFATGRRVTNPALVVLAAPRGPGADREGRVVFVAGKRLGNAVKRNRAKRVLREALRRVGGPWAGWDVALIARGGTPQASPEALDRALQAAAVKLGITR